MNWHSSVWHWLVYSALASTLLLGLASLAVGCFIRQPVRRLRAMQLALAATLIAPWLNQVPALARWRLPTLGESAAEADPLPPFPDNATLGAAGVRFVAPREPAPAGAGPLTPRTDRPVESTSPRAAFAGGAWLPSIPLAVATVYLAGLAALALRYALGLFRLARLRAQSREAPPGLVELLHDIVGRAAGRVRLGVSDTLRVPVAFGWWRPTILLPRALLETAEPDDLRFVLAHEWSHLARRDVITCHLALAVRTVFWYQPLAWWLRRQVRLCQDYLADADAAAQGDSVENYATCLVHVARQNAALPALAALGFGDGRLQLSRRIKMLLSKQGSIDRKCGSWWSMSAALASAAVLLAVSSLALTAADPPAGQPLDGVAASAAKTFAEKLAELPVLKLPAGPNVIEGRCHDGSGNGLASVAVALLQYNGRAVHQGFVTQTKTDDKGRFRFERLPDYGRDDEQWYDYWIVAQAEGRATAIANESLDPIFAKFVDLALPERAAVSGRVVDLQGNPIEGALVRFERLNSPIEGVCNARTDAKGEFFVGDLAPGNYGDAAKKTGPDGRPQRVPHPTFTVEHTDYAREDHRYERVPSTANVVLKPGAVIAGKVLYGDSDKPAPGIRIRLQAAIHYPGNLEKNPTLQATTSTNDQGDYRLTSLRPGRYNVWADAEGWTCRALDAFEVVARQTATAPPLTLIQGGWLEGRLIDADSGEAVHIGADERVRIGVHGPARPRSGSAIEFCKASEDGSFRIRLAPGLNWAYFLFSGPFRPRGEQHPKFGTFAEEVLIQEGETTHVEFRVTRKEP